MLSNHATSGSLEKGTPLLMVRFSARGFGSRLAHCQQLAAYLTTVVSSNLPEQQSWTEALEQVLTSFGYLVCMTGGIVGDVELNLTNRGQLATMCFEIPTNHRYRNLYGELARFFRASKKPDLPNQNLNEAEAELNTIIERLSASHPTKMQTKNNEIAGILKILFQVHLNVYDS